jgi:serine/threonine protein phosphatase PrpC
MLVPAQAGGIGADRSVAVWHHSRRNLHMVAVWSEKRPGLGEDAEPTFLHHEAGDRGLLGVYDGLGGAGARHAGRSADGRQLTHAFVASRLAHLAVQSWYAEHVTATGAGSLRDRLAEVLTSARSAGRAKIGGTLRRDFPTTLALLEYERKGSTVDVTARWAGDSRCFLLTAHTGLQQVSRDDTEVQDPLELLIADQPMTNLASATGTFTVNERHLPAAPLPCVLLCATDGFFGYVAAPALFEYAVLDELRRSRDETEWARNLARRVMEYTADDASLVLVALGFSSFPRLRASFAHRLADLHANHWQPVQHVRSREELVEVRRRSWESYRSRYMHYVEHV